jgi:NitT/TauT family transport system ATP-binding protein
MKENRARRTLGTAIEWGRYGELYEYDFHLKRLKLPTE